MQLANRSLRTLQATRLTPRLIDSKPLRDGSIPQNRGPHFYGGEPDRSPSSVALATACVRLRTFSRSQASPTYWSTVRDDKPRVAAISREVFPAAARRKHSIWRGLRLAASLGTGAPTGLNAHKNRFLKAFFCFANDVAAYRLNQPEAVPAQPLACGRGARQMQRPGRAWDKVTFDAQERQPRDHRHSHALGCWRAAPPGASRRAQRTCA
jgi:hypothetical protein